MKRSYHSRPEGPARVGPPALFLYKTAVLQGLLLLPMAFPSVSGRYYRYRAVWAPILSTMTSSQHLGETLHGFVYRLLGSLGGALFGFITWEIGSRNPWVGFPEDDLVFANITAVQVWPCAYCELLSRIQPMRISIRLTFTRAVYIGILLWLVHVCLSFYSSCLPLTEICVVECSIPNKRWSSLPSPPTPSFLATHGKTISIPM